MKSFFEKMYIIDFNYFMKYNDGDFDSLINSYNFKYGANIFSEPFILFCYLKRKKKKIVNIEDEVNDICDNMPNYKLFYVRNLFQELSNIDNIDKIKHNGIDSVVILINKKPHTYEIIIQIKQ
jgi:hypothetical protein